MLVYDFARGGDTTEGVERQIKNEFIPGLVDDIADLQVGFDPELRVSDAIWAGSDTLFSKDAEYHSIYYIEYSPRRMGWHK